MQTLFTRSIFCDFYGKMNRGMLKLTSPSSYIESWDIDLTVQSHADILEFKNLSNFARSSIYSEDNDIIQSASPL